MNKLNEELLAQVLNFLQVPEIITAQQCCKLWYKSAQKVNKRNEFLIEKITLKPIKDYDPHHSRDIAERPFQLPLIRKMLDAKIPLILASLLQINLREKFAEKALRLIGKIIFVVAATTNKGDVKDTEIVNFGLLMSSTLLDKIMEMMYHKSEAILHLTMWCFVNLTCSDDDLFIFQSPCFPKFIGLLKFENLPDIYVQKVLVKTLANMLSNPLFQIAFVENKWSPLLVAFLRKKESENAVQDLEVKAHIFRALMCLAPAFPEVVLDTGIFQDIKNLPWAEAQNKLLAGVNSGSETEAQSEISTMIQEASYLATFLAPIRPTVALELLVDEKFQSFAITALKSVRVLIGNDWKGSITCIFKVISALAGNIALSQQIPQKQMESLIDAISSVDGCVGFQLQKKRVLYELALVPAWKPIVAEFVSKDLSYVRDEMDIRRIFNLTIGFVERNFTMPCRKMQVFESISDYLFKKCRKLLEQKSELEVIEMVIYGIGKENPVSLFMEDNLTRFILLLLVFGKDFFRTHSWAMKAVDEYPHSKDETALVNKLIEEAKHFPEMQGLDTLEAPSKRRRIPNLWA